MSASKYRSTLWTDPRTEVRASSLQGNGMFAKEPISEGEIVGVIGGTIMTTAQFQEYITTVPYYNATQIGEDAHLVEPPGVPRGMNHSCDSNVWMRDEVTLVARRDIRAGEELTVDYALMSGLPGDLLKEPCRCGSPVCRGIITGDDWQLPEIQARYRDHFSPFLNERIRHFSH